MNFCLKNGFGAEFTGYEGEVMKEGVLTSFTFCDAVLRFTHNNVTSQIRSQREYLIPSDHSIVLG